MPNLPCDRFGECIDLSNPLTNYSAEAPDNLTYLGFHWPWVDPNNPVGNDTPTNYSAEGCQTLCESSISQADADLCAARQAFICANTGGPGNDIKAPTFFFSNLQQCSISCPDGSAFSFRAFPGAFVNISQAAADEQAAEYACNGAAFYLMCLSSIPGACANQAYSAVITSSRTPNPPYTFAIVAGSLPPGLTFTQGTNQAIISGTPTVAGNYTFTVQVTDLSGNTMQRSYTLGVLQISNSPTSASVGSAYSFQFNVTGGTAPYTFVLEGALPAGLTMSSSGLITGTPTAAGTTNFTVTVADTAGNPCVANFSITTTGCDCTISWFPSVGPCRLRIKGYFDGLVSNCPAGVASGAPAWDGTLSRWDPPPNNINGEYAAPITPPATSMNGKVLWAVTIVFTGTTFTLAILGDSGGISTTAWSGSLTSSCPIGVYTRNIGCSAGPATISIEGYVP